MYVTAQGKNEGSPPRAVWLSRITSAGALPLRIRRLPCSVLAVVTRLGYGYRPHVSSDRCPPTG